MLNSQCQGCFWEERVNICLETLKIQMHYCHLWNAALATSRVAYHVRESIATSLSCERRVAMQGFGFCRCWVFSTLACHFICLWEQVGCQSDETDGRFKSRLYCIFHFVMLLENIYTLEFKCFYCIDLHVSITQWLIFLTAVFLAITLSLTRISRLLNASRLEIFLKLHLSS